MALTDAQRLKVSARFQDQLSALPPGKKETVSVSKHRILDTIGAMDDWVDANAASFNAAIPERVRTTFTPQQKARLLYWVVRARSDPENV